MYIIYILFLGLFVFNALMLGKVIEYRQVYAVHI